MVVGGLGMAGFVVASLRSRIPGLHGPGLAGVDCPG